MAKITIVNISDETIAVRPSVTAEKVPLEPGQKLECDRDYAEANCLKTYADFFRVEDGGIQPGLKEVLTFIEKATDEEKTEIITALGISPATVPADDEDPTPDAPDQKTEEAETTDTAGADEQTTEGDSAPDTGKETATKPPVQPKPGKKA